MNEQFYSSSDWNGVIYKCINELVFLHNLKITQHNYTQCVKKTKEGVLFYIFTFNQLSIWWCQGMIPLYRSFITEFYTCLSPVYLSENCDLWSHALLSVSYEESGEKKQHSHKMHKRKTTTCVRGLAQAKMVSSLLFLVRMVPGLCWASGWLASSGGQVDTGLSKMACFRS